MVPKRIVKDTSCPPAFCPCYGHIDRPVSSVRTRYDGKTSCGQHFYSWVNVQVVLLTFYLKIFNMFKERTGATFDIYHVLHSIIAWVSHPLPARHKLPIYVVTERVTHPAMQTCKTYAALYSRRNVIHQFLFNLAHRP